LATIVSRKILLSGVHV